MEQQCHPLNDSGVCIHYLADVSVRHKYIPSCKVTMDKALVREIEHPQSYLVVIAQQELIMGRVSSNNVFRTAVR